MCRDLTDYPVKGGFTLKKKKKSLQHGSKVVNIYTLSYPIGNHLFLQSLARLKKKKIEI